MRHSTRSARLFRSVLFGMGIALCSTGPVALAAISDKPVASDDVEVSTTVATEEQTETTIAEDDSKMDDSDGDAAEQVVDESDDESTEKPDNHGKVVSEVAKSTEAGPDHGKTVSAVAKGNHGHSEDTTDE